MFFLFFPVGIITSLILHFVYKTEIVSNGRVFGVLMPKNALEDSEINELLTVYKKRISVVYKIFFLFLMATYFASDYISISMTLFFIYIFGMIFVYSYIFSRFSKRVEKIKVEKGYFVESDKFIAIDTEVARLKNTFPLGKIYFLPPIIVYTACFLLFGADDIITNIIPISMTALSVVASAAIYFVFCSVRGETLSAESEINIAISRAKLRGGSKIAFFYCYSAIIFLPLYFLEDISLVLGNLGFVILMIAYTAANTLYTITEINKSRGLQEKLLSGRDDNIIADDSEYYKFGFYCNKNDRKVFVTKPIGYGSTINIATIPGKIFLIVTAAIFVFVFVQIVHVYGYDFGSITITDNNESFAVNSPGYATEINYADIAEVELVSEVNTTGKIHGAATSSMRVGSFRVSDIGECRVYLMSSSESAVKIEMLDGEIVFISGESDFITKGIYDTIKAGII